MENPDYRMYKNFYNWLTLKGQKNPFGLTMPFLLHPYDTPEMFEEMSKKKIDSIKIPVYTGQDSMRLIIIFIGRERSLVERIT